MLERIGNYLIRRQVGEGGMATVFLGENPHIDKRVAIKVLKAEFARNEVVAERFINEGRAVNKIQNEHLVQVLDFARLPDGTPYLVMEWLDGVSLADLVRDVGRLAIDRAARIASEIAEAVGAAHARGVIHRDLKPDNVFLVTRHGNPDFVKVLDFGIAKLQLDRATLAGREGEDPEADDTQSSQNTQDGAFLGTVHYMSPEQCQGLHSRIDARADIYSLGVMLYQMVTGVLPFDDPAIGEVIFRHIREAPRPPSEHEPAVPPALEAAILRMMAKEPEARFATMGEVRVALQPFTGRAESAALERARARTVMGAQFTPPSAPSVQATTPKSDQGSRPPKSDQGSRPPKSDQGTQQPVARPTPAPARTFKSDSGVGGESIRPVSAVGARRRYGATTVLWLSLWVLAVGAIGFTVQRHRARDAATTSTAATRSAAVNPTPESAPQPPADVAGKLAFDRYLEAVKSADYDLCVARFAEIPAGSEYRKQAELTLPLVRKSYVDGHLREATQLLAAARCDEAKAHAQLVIVVDENNADAAHVVDACNRLQAAPRPGENPAPHVAPGHPHGAPRPDLKDPYADEQPVKRGKRAVAALADAAELYKHGHYREALDETHAVLAAEPKNIKAWKLAGVTSCFLKDRDGALAAFSHVSGGDQNTITYVCTKNGLTVP